MGMLGGTPRLARALTTAAAIGGWDGGGPGSTMGLACASLSARTSACSPKRRIGADQRIEVSRLVAAVDCGRIVNPGLVRQQIEGGLLAALACATVASAGIRRRHAARRADARPRLSSGCTTCPRSRSSSSAATSAPGGVSGLGMAVLAPAVANAICRRHRQALAQPAVRPDERGMTLTHPTMPPRRRRAAGQPRHARRARAGGGAPLPGRIPVRPARDRDPAARSGSRSCTASSSAPARQKSAQAYARCGPRRARRWPRSPSAQARALQERLGDDVDRRAGDALRQSVDRPTRSIA